MTAQEAAQLLQAPWPGNVRQLVNIAERAVLQNRRGSGSIASLLMADNEASGPAMTTEGKPLKDYVDAFERMLIDNTMRRHKGSIVAVMEELCLPRRTLNEKMAKYGLQPVGLRLTRCEAFARTAIRTADVVPGRAAECKHGNCALPFAALCRYGRMRRGSCARASSFAAGAHGSHRRVRT